MPRSNKYPENILVKATKRTNATKNKELLESKVFSSPKPSIKLNTLLNDIQRINIKTHGNNARRSNIKSVTDDQIDLP
ncbi:hypothetical protein TMU01_12150 [Tenuibacillus multivorans]|nr:hypothetical protein TMU01_12150 [Tenuibacillus multivorans]